MKILSLYIDKWYIVGAVIDGANKFPLSLNNAEDRVWLYFYSNSTANAVRYSLSYRDEALEGKKGYYGDIFDMLPDYKEYHFEKYGTRKDMKDIFADAGIFTDFKKSFEGISSVHVYLSFSKDIDIVSQHIFIKALEEEQFKVLQYTAPIEKLAMKYVERRSDKLSDTKFVLVVNACNENLHYSIYKRDSEDTPFLLSEKCEPGYGVDSRIQAIVEEVLEYLQADTHFLTGNTEERHEEMLYLSQFANEWLAKLDNSPSHAPVALGNVHFKKQANNEIPVVVHTGNINDRTHNIVEKLTGKIVDMIKEENILLPDISNIIFLGDMFSNSSFVESLQQKIGVNNEQIVLFPELSLPDVVSIYDVWGKDAFGKEKTEHVESVRKKYISDRQKSVELKTRGLKERAEEAENENRLQDAIDFYNRVLCIDSQDEYSKARINALKERIEQIQRDIERVNQLLEKISQDFTAGKYAESIVACDDVLRIQKDNVEAKQIKENAETTLKRKQILEDSIKKMNNLILEGQFYDARNILQKVDSQNLNDARLRDIRESIEHGISRLESQVTERTAAYNDARKANDLKLCLRLCEELITIGADSRKWSEIKQSLIEEIKQEQRYQDNFDLARKARLNQNWHELIEYAQKALSVRDEKELYGWIAEAKDAINREKVDQVQELFSKSYADGQWDKVIELYDEHTSLHQKSSNSSMYSNAKRFRKNAVHAPRPTPPLVKPKETVEKTVDTPNKRRTPRPGPSRPNVASRPKVEKQLTSKTSAVEKTQPTQGRPRVNRPQRDLNTTGKKETEKTVGTTPDIETSNNSTSNKRIINKPKR